MKSVWRVHQNTNIEVAGDNLFLIHFQSQMEKVRIMNSRAWSFDKALIGLVSPKANDVIGKYRIQGSIFLDPNP